jgi:UDP-2,3-diacylglucosamine pyrophosphatase LpxH
VPLAYGKTETESLLVFSDVHLGSDLNDNGPTTPRSAAIDADLAELLAHYRTRATDADRWHLVIAGDFIDFVGMAIDPCDTDALATEPTEVERSFGLGGAEDHVQLKLRRAAARHREVFAELGRFVGAGHALTLIHGNHDLELHWDSVKRDFCELIATGAGLAERELQEVTSRVAFSPWFFYREGLVFIEHGHQYDPFCSVPHILAPLSPMDPRRVEQSLSDTLLRYIVRRTPGMKEYGHEERGLASYISWGLMLGARGAIALFQRFFRVVTDLTARARAYASETAKQIRAEHERRLAELSRTTSLSEATLRSALALHCRPIGATARGVLASVMLDRLGLFVLMSVLLAAIFAAWGRLGTLAAPLTCCLVATWATLHVVLSRGRPKVDPADVMVARAGELARLFPSSFVVMGHTHVPTTQRLGRAFYVNLGSWAEEEPDPGQDHAKAYRAARTHLVIHDRGGRHEAQLLEWRSGEGPRELEALRPATQ